MEYKPEDVQMINKYIKREVAPNSWNDLIPVFAKAIIHLNAKMEWRFTRTKLIQSVMDEDIEKTYSYLVKAVRMITN